MMHIRNCFCSEHSMNGSRLIAFLLSTVCAMLLGAGVHAAEPAALVTDLQGGAARSGTQTLAILAELAAAAPLELAAGTRLTLVHFAGARQFDLEGPGVFRLTAAGVEATAGGRVTARAPLSAAFDKVRLRPAQVVQASITMRGGAGQQVLKLATPVGTWVLDARPDFRWQTIAGVARYRFQLTDDTGRLLHDVEIAGDVAVLPASLALKAGQIYGWQVSAAMPDGKVAEGWAEFGILDDERRARIAAAQPDSAAPVADRILFAVLLEDNGLREAARALWAQLLRERPADPQLQARGAAQ
jgi:hypothetical protein